MSVDVSLPSKVLNNVLLDTWVLSGLQEERIYSEHFHGHETREHPLRECWIQPD